jgi:hypothetical protein
VTTCVQEDVCERAPDLQRGAQDPRVETLEQDWPVPAEDAIHRPGQPGADCLHPARKGAGIRSFHDAVCVVVEERVLHEAKVPPVAALAKAALDGADDPRDAQRGDPRLDLERHVHRKALRNAGRRSVRYGTTCSGLAPGAGAMTTPAALPRKQQIELPDGPTSVSLHQYLNRAIL